MRFGAIASALALFLSSATGASDGALLEKGRYLVYAGGCISCHTEKAKDAIPLAGGYALKTSFGTFIPLSPTL